MLDPLPRFIAQIIAIVLLSRVVGLATRKLGQPMVVAEIAAGILLGPSVLGWLLPEVWAGLFAPESLELLHLVSNLGLVLFMFLIGLEFDPKLSRERVRAALLTSQAGLLVPLALGVLLALQLHDELAPSSVSAGGFALFFGVVLSISAFPVVARILAERRLLRSRVGVVTITCVAIDDLIAWCLAAFVVGWARADGVAAAAWTSALALVYVAAMLLLVRPLLERLARRFAGSPELGHDRIAVVMLLLFASSWATAMIGIHAMFGAFLFGAILPRDGGLAHALADKLEDVVVVVLLPLFFAYSGVRTHIGLLDSSAAWLTCALILVVACVGKLGASTLAARLSGLSWRESTALGVLMNTRGLVVLVMLNIGLDLGIISPTLFTMLVIMALFTTFLATPVLDVVYPIGQHVTDLLTTPPDSVADSVADDVAHEPAQEPAFSLLLCFADRGPGRGLRALAGALADTPDVRLHALQLRRHPSRPDDDALALPIKHMSFVSSDPADDICRVAEVKGADLVLIERDEASVRERDWAGPTTRRVLLECRRDVAVLIDAQLERIERALVLGSAGSSDAVTTRLAAAGVELLRGEAKPSALARVDHHVDLLVLARELAEPPLLDACLELHGRGVSLLIVQSGGTPTGA
ncbi:MAG TPA: cation:proton antiporter [Enhygromyxa sp.]|nr:cation:proton antiporter [Enhygromyxa sp.]